MPAVIVIEDTDDEDEDEGEDPEGTSASFIRPRIVSDVHCLATVEPPRRPKIVAVQPRRSPRLAGLPPEMEGLGMRSCPLSSLCATTAHPTFVCIGERNAARRVRRTKADFLEVA